MNEIKHLSGLPIQVGNLFVHPLRLKDIAEIGLNTYKSFLSYYLIEDKEIEIMAGHKITLYEYFCGLAYANYPEGLSFVDAIEKILGLKLSPLPLDDKVLLVADTGLEITATDFYAIQETIREQYFLSESQNITSFKPGNDKARELKEKLDKIKAELNKDTIDNKIDIGDIISIVSAYTPNINIIDIWDLTVYQLYHLYIRLLTKEQYHSEFQQLLQGVDPTKLKLEHWANKLAKE